MSEPFSPSLGWQRDLPDPRDFGPDHPTVRKILRRLKRRSKKQAELPPNVDLSEYFPPVIDAKGLNASPAYACAAVAEYFQRRCRGDMTPSSAIFLYKMARKLLHHTGDTGVDLRTTLKALARFGLPPAKFWPNDPSRLDHEPAPMLYSCSFAEPFRSLRYVRLDSRDTTGPEALEIVKAFLAAGFPSVFGISAPISMTADPDIPYRPTFDSLRGGQALIAVGYDNSKLTTPKGALQVRNSSDPTWGEAGYGWLPYVYAQERLATDFWSISRKDWLNSSKSWRTEPTNGIQGRPPVSTNE